MEASSYRYRLHSRFRVTGGNKAVVCGLVYVPGGGSQQPVTKNKEGDLTTKENIYGQEKRPHSWDPGQGYAQHPVGFLGGEAIYYERGARAFCVFLPCVQSEP